jgi:cathepsin X
MENSITDETCSLYQAKGHTNGLKCSDFLRCGNCAERKGCWPVEEYDTYTVETWGTVYGEENMIQEIF